MEKINFDFFIESNISLAASKVMRSETFWKGVDAAVNFFEPLANVLRRMDSDVPAMGFLYGCLLDAKKDISKRFDNDEQCFKAVLILLTKGGIVS